VLPLLALIASPFLLVSYGEEAHKYFGSPQPSPFVAYSVKNAF
jgi:hypothetical protein